MTGRSAKSSSSGSATELTGIASRVRGKIIELSNKVKAPHLGGALSCSDILVAAYWGVLNIDPDDPVAEDRDRLVFSKGHAAAALYTCLCLKGFFPESVLDSYATPGSNLAEHPGPFCVPGVEVATGSLGHGLPIGVGMALSAIISKSAFRVYVIMSDGECNEGSVWEAAMFAPRHNLERLAVIIDNNGWQATGRSDEVMALQPLKEKWEAFGWSAYDIDGHDMESLLKVMRNVPDGSGKPVAIVARTVKGKGVHFMEDDNNWHYRIPTIEEVAAAKAELGLQ